MYEMKVETDSAKAFASKARKKIDKVIDETEK